MADQQPRALRWAGIGAAAAAAAGAVAGLVLGLRAYPPTAWFAVFEVGIPAAIVGGTVGFASGAVAAALHRR